MAERRAVDTETPATEVPAMELMDQEAMDMAAKDTAGEKKAAMEAVSEVLEALGDSEASGVLAAIRDMRRTAICGLPGTISETDILKKRERCWTI